MKHINTGALPPTVPYYSFSVYSLSKGFIAEFDGTSSREATVNFIQSDSLEPDNYYVQKKGLIGRTNPPCPRCGYKNHRISHECDNCGEIL